MYDEKHVDEKHALLPVRQRRPIFTYSKHATTPDAIAHRGFCAKYPENTMASFSAAIACGAQALETDVHLSKDGVVMLSHDATLNRCFGIDKKIIDCDYAYLKTLKTTRSPQQAMPTLFDLLNVLDMPQNSHMWLLLDIKTDNIADDIMKRIAKTIYSVNSSASYWQGRIKLGVWHIDFVPLCNKYLSGFPITFIGWSTVGARPFLKVPGASFNMLFKSLVGPIGKHFLKQARSQGRDVFVWTVNDRALMKLAIQMGMNGVCTDDPAVFLEVCRNYKAKLQLVKEQISLRKMVLMWSASFFPPICAYIMKRRFQLRLRNDK